MTDHVTLTVTQLAKYLGKSRPTMYQMINDGRFPVAPIKGTSPSLWSRQEVDQWLHNK